MTRDEFVRAAAQARVVLAIYDPTIDLKADPVFMDADDDFAPIDRPEIDHHRVSDGLIWLANGDDLLSEDERISPKDLRVTLDGRMVKGAFEASKSGGWVRFLAMRPNDNGCNAVLGWTRRCDRHRLRQCRMARKRQSRTILENEQRTVMAVTMIVPQ